MRRTPALSYALAISVALPGCRTLADRVGAPQAEPIPEQLRVAIERQWPTRTVRTPDGVTLAYRIVEPSDPALEIDYVRGDRGFAASFRLALPNGPIEQVRGPGVASAGTVVLLHGWGSSGATMLPWASAFGRHGYRSVLLDLRNHGASDAGTPGFGTTESADVVALVDALEQHGHAPRPLHLFGVSYGGAVAVQAAERLGPERVAGTVALAPFANAADAVRDVAHDARRRAPMPSARLEREIVAMGTRFGYDLSTVDLRTSLTRSQACTLVLHGARDRVVPPSRTEALAGASARVHRVQLPHDDHASAALRTAWLAAPIAAWFANAVEGCAEPRIPDDPLGSPR